MGRFEQHPARRAAVVTGASSGIGRAVALLLGGAGYPVVLAARRTDRCEATAAEIRAGGGEAWALPLDVCDVGSVEEFAVAATEAAGPIEILVSNAGDVLPIATIDTTPDEFAEQVAVNLSGPQHLVHKFGPGMVQRARGDVVFVSSEVAGRARPHMAGYVAAKTGLEGVANAMRLEMEGSGVRVGIVRPGPTSTEQGRGWATEHVERAVSEWSRHGLMRHGGYLLPEQVAAAVLFVVSAPRGSAITLVEVQPEAPVTKPGGRS